MNTISNARSMNGIITLTDGFTIIENGSITSDNITTNKSFYFTNGMFNNFINIKITEFDAVTLWTDSNNNAPNDYILCLTFELME